MTEKDLIYPWAECVHVVERIDNYALVKVLVKSDDTDRKKSPSRALV